MQIDTSLAAIPSISLITILKYRRILSIIHQNHSNQIARRSAKMKIKIGKDSCWSIWQRRTHRCVPCLCVCVCLRVWVLWHKSPLGKCWPTWLTNLNQNEKRRQEDSFTSTRRREKKKTRQIDRPTDRQRDRERERERESLETFSFLTF